MNDEKRSRILKGVSMALLAAGMVAAGCESTGGETTGEAPSAPPAKSGAQLWVENCGRCHNYRNPGSFSDAQWDVAVHHMRMRVPLTGRDQKAILEFLKSAVGH